MTPGSIGMLATAKKPATAGKPTIAVRPATCQKGEKFVIKDKKNIKSRPFLIDRFRSVPIAIGLSDFQCC